VSEECYPQNLIAMLEAVWGEGFLSPDGPAEVARVLEGHDLSCKSVLDIGSGTGGIDVALATTHGAGCVTGIDDEDGVIARVRALVSEKGLTDRTGIAKVAPGPLPFPPATFDVVFSKDSIIHISDKHAPMAEVARVLKPGGWFLASDWLIWTEEISPQTAEYIAAEGLDFGMATPARYPAARQARGFRDIRITSRNTWYREGARRKVARMRGDLRTEAARSVSQVFVDQNIGIWERMMPVLDTGEHCPTHLAGRRP
jgi:SAM-dependent methyltransferase